MNPDLLAGMPWAYISASKDIPEDEYDRSVRMVIASRRRPLILTERQLRGVSDRNLRIQEDIEFCDFFVQCVGEDQMDERARFEYDYARDKGKAFLKPSMEGLVAA